MTTTCRVLLLAVLSSALAACGSGDDSHDDTPNAGSNSADGAANRAGEGGAGRGGSSAGTGGASAGVGAGSGGDAGSDRGGSGRSGSGGKSGMGGVGGECDSQCQMAMECPMSCSGHGACSDATCDCDEGYEGAACESCTDGYHRAGDGESCTRDLCDPNHCIAGLICEPSSGYCCETTCTPGEGQCSAGEQRVCFADGLGCFKWSAPAACGPGGCADAQRCAPLADDATAEQWGSRLDDEVVSAVALDAGHVALLGRTSEAIAAQPSFGSSDVYLMKRNPELAVDWTEQIGTHAFDDAAALVRSSDGTFAFAGDAPGTFDASDAPGSGLFLARRAADGSALALARWGGVEAHAYGLAEDGAGDLYVVGFTTGDFADTSAGDWDAFLSKLDADGNELWSRQWGTTQQEVAIGVAVGGSGDVYVTGLSYGDLDGNDGAGSSDAFLTKFDDQGTKQWTRTLGSSADDSGNAVAVDGSGAILVAGTANDALGGSGAGGAFLAKWAANGDQLWVEQWGPSSAGAIELAIDADGAVFVAGAANGPVDDGSPVGGWDPFVSKWTQSGMSRSRLWSKQLGTTQDEAVDALAIGADGTVFVGGSTAGAFPGFSNMGGRDSYLLRITQ